MRNAGFAEMIDFTRPGAATYVGADGVIRIAAANVPRFDHTNGRRQLLLEGPATNVLNAYAAPSSLTNVTKSGQSAGEAILSIEDDAEALTAAGLAVLTAGKCYKLDNTAGAKTANLRFLTTFDSTSPKVFSVWMRGSDGIAMRTGYGGYPLKPTSPDAYRRVSVNTTEIAVGGTNAADLLEVGVPAGGVGYVVCPQVEAGLVPSSYIPTHGSAVTRPADRAQLTETVAALLRDEFSLVLQGRGVSGPAGRFVGVSSNSAYDGAIVQLNSDENAVILKDPGTVISEQVSVPLPPFGVAVAGSAAGRSGTFNGRAPSGDAGAFPEFERAYIGRNDLGRFGSGWYDQLVIWPFRMTDADLQAKAVPYA